MAQNKKFQILYRSRANYNNGVQWPRSPAAAERLGKFMPKTLDMSGGLDLGAAQVFQSFN